MFCCLLELVAAPGLTFKASNAAFQAAPGGEHGAAGRGGAAGGVIKAKMPRRAGNGLSRAGASAYFRDTLGHAYLPSDTAVLPKGTPKASPTLKWPRGIETCPRGTAGAGLGGVFRAASNSPISYVGDVFKRTCCTLWCKDCRMGTAPQAACMEHWRLSPAHRVCAASRNEPEGSFPPLQTSVPCLHNGGIWAPGPSVAGMCPSQVREPSKCPRRWSRPVSLLPQEQPLALQALNLLSATSALCRSPFPRC